MLTVKVTRRFSAALVRVRAGLLGLERAGAAHRQQMGRDPRAPQHGPDDLGARRAEGEIRCLVARRIRMADDHHAHRKAQALATWISSLNSPATRIEHGILAMRGPRRIRVEGDDVRLDGVAQADERRILNVLESA